MTLYQTILYIITSLLLWITWLLILLRNKKSIINLSLFLFTISTILWMISMYLWYYFVNPNDIFISTLFIRLAFSFGITTLFFLCIFSYNFPKISLHIPKYIRITFIFTTILLSLISAFSDLVYESEVIIDNKLVADVNWPLHPIFILYTITCIFFVIWILIKKMFLNRGIEKNKIIIVLWWTLSIVIGVTIFHIILPIFEIYLLQSEVVVFCLLFVILVFYSMTKYRFLNISSLLLKISRNIIIMVIFLFTCLSIFNWINYLFPNFTQTINIIISTFIWLSIFKFSENLIPEFINRSEKEFRNAIKEFKSNIGLYENYELLIKSLEKVFILKLNIHNAKLLLIRDKQIKANIPILIKNDFTSKLKNYDILVKDEIKFLNTNKTEKEILFKNMEQLNASICIPLFFKKTLIWLFTLWSKSWEQIYSKEEIELILWLKRKLGTSFINILIKKRLQEENDLMKQIINNKTKNLKIQNKEIKELLKQQSDFMAVTAHEFRTPLSSAIFQVENILDTYHSTGEVFDEINSVWNSLENLKLLTEKLFEVQQIDLNKIKLNIENTNTNNLLKNIYDNVKLIADKCNIQFEYVSYLEKNESIKVDKMRINQVFNNLLSNAIKYCKSKWKILMSLNQDKKNILISIEDNWPWIPDKEKKTIFNKFKTINKIWKTWIWLWLYISKKYIQMHKWDIKITDAPKWWTVVTIYLPKK